MNTEEQNIFMLLKEVIDPELMVNIIDLGLVYGVTLNKDKKEIVIDLTLTSPGCPLGEVITEDAQQIISKNYPEFKVKINLVWEPAWSLENLTPEGRTALGSV